MSIDRLVSNVMDILSELGVLDITGELVDEVARGDPDVDISDELSAIANVVTPKKAVVNNLLDLIIKIRGDRDEARFWDAVGNCDCSPIVFQVFCLALIKESVEMRRIGTTIYVVLLGMQPISLIWNQRIFGDILMIMVAATQFLDGGNHVIGAQEGKAIALTGQILGELGRAMSEQFLKLMGNDILIALIELSTKMCTIAHKNLYRHFAESTQKAMSFLDAAARVSLYLTLPAVVLALILDFLPQGKVLTSTIILIRDSFIEFCVRHLAGKDVELKLVASHVLMRTAERSVLRESAAYVGYRLMKVMADPDMLIDFAFKMSRSQKGTHRVVAMELFQCMICEGGVRMDEEMMLRITDSVCNCISDQRPNVRAAAMQTTAVLIPHASDEIAVHLGIISDDECDNGRVVEFVNALRKRITDEKLTVRKSAVKCVKALVQSSKDYIDIDIMALLAERIQDKSVQIRQEAAEVLSNAMLKFDLPSFVQLWLDNVMALALDNDTKTQDFALRKIDTCFLSAIDTDIGMAIAMQMNENHVGVLAKILTVFKQKAMSLRRFVKSVEQRLKVECHPVFWKLENVLVSVVPELVHKKHTKLWKGREKLPVEYLSVVAKIGVTDDDILADAAALVRGVASGEIVGVDFSEIHWMTVLFASAQKNLESEAMTLVSMMNDRVNEVAWNERLGGRHIKNLTCAIFLMGELFEHCSRLKDLNFTGLQLMVSENLPNKVRVPDLVRASATVSLGKLCLWCRDISSAFVAAFASQLHRTGNAAVKCNCLVVLCDLCVKYSATVDPYVMDMSECFADADPSVRRQALLIITKLVAEDFMKIRQLLFFRFIFCLVDMNESIAQFAESCLFDVIGLKDPRFMIDYFIQAMMYFVGSLDTVVESSESRRRFMIANKELRRRAYMIMISRMNSTVRFQLLQSTCTVILQDFIDENKDVVQHASLLGDAFCVMSAIEDEMDEFNLTEASASDDPRAEKIVSESRKIVTCIHNQLIRRVLPILNQIHRRLRERNSSLQTDLRLFFKKICSKHPALLDELARQEPVLAAELESDIATEQTAETTPHVLSYTSPFRSPLLSRIARSPQTPRAAQLSQRTTDEEHDSVKTRLVIDE